MAIEFNENEVTAKTIFVGDDEFAMTAGNRLQVRDNETGEIVDRLDVTVPEGKAWNVTVFVRIEESDA